MRAMRLLGLALVASAIGSGLAFGAGQEASTEDSAAASGSMGATEIVKIVHPDHRPRQRQRAADSPIHSGNWGIDSSTSTTRCTASSTHPPK